jgi:hypothetical protein
MEEAKMLYPDDFEHLAALSALVSRWVQRHRRTGPVTEHQLMTLVDSHSARQHCAANEKARPQRCAAIQRI